MNLDDELRRLFTDDRLDLPVRPGAERIIAAGVRRRHDRRAVLGRTGIAAVLIALVAVPIGLVRTGGGPESPGNSGVAATASATTSATAGSCEVQWGSGTKSGPPAAGGNMVALRVGQHDCYDRLVLDVRRPVGGYLVSYVDEVTEDATGNLVPLRGGAKLLVTIYSPAYDESGAPTYTYANRAELADVTGFQTFRQVAWAGSWEGTTSLGLGVRARLPFQVSTLEDRLVVDVAHFW